MFFQSQFSELGTDEPQRRKPVKKYAIAKKKTTARKPPVAASRGADNLTAAERARNEQPATSLAARAASRRITITGTASLGSIGLESISRITAQLRQRFENQGWQLPVFDIRPSGNWMSYSSAAIIIEANVSNDYTNQQHRDLASSKFSEFTISNGITSWQPFEHVALDVTAGSDKPDYTAPAETTIKATPTPQRSDNHGGGGGGSSSNSGGGKPDDGESFLGKLWGDLGFGVGVSATTALVVGGIFVIIMLKK